MVFCIAKKIKLENVAYVRKLSISQLANIIQSDTIDFLVGETWGYKINPVNKCGTASLGYFKNRAATGDLLQHYEYWVHHMGRENALSVALQLQHDAGLILSNVQFARLQTPQGMRNCSTSVTAGAH